ncbi:MAG: hypothetical protein AAFV53_00325 [Myxococcota bacterium]
MIQKLFTILLLLGTFSGGVIVGQRADSGPDLVVTIPPMPDPTAWLCEGAAPVTGSMKQACEAIRDLHPGVRDCILEVDTLKAIQGIPYLRPEQMRQLAEDPAAACPGVLHSIDDATLDAIIEEPSRKGVM